MPDKTDPTPDAPDAPSSGALFRIWCHDFRVGGDQCIKVTRGSEILSVFGDNHLGHLTIWVKEVATRPVVLRRIVVVSGSVAGVSANDSQDVLVCRDTFIGTVIDGPYVWHVFDGGEVEE